MTIEVDGWQITFFIDCGDLDYCDNRVSPDGRKYEFSSKQAFDPVGLLSPGGASTARRTASSYLNNL